MKLGGKKTNKKMRTRLVKPKEKTKCKQSEQTETKVTPRREGAATQEGCGLLGGGTP